MPTAIPLSDYVPGRVRAAQVFQLEAAPKSSPIDINLPVVIQESGWSLSDRLRFWHTLGGGLPHTGLTIRKLDLDDKTLVHCTVAIDGTLSILSNNRESATRFFRTVFLNSPPTFAGARNWKVRSRWTADKTTVAFFAGSVAGALGWGPKVPHEIEISLKEALDNLERRNWKSCVVMCRRALQALMEAAYEKQFGAKPGKLDLNAVTRKFEALTPSPIPRHWLNAADLVRNLGNIPGAHPRAIPRYRFSSQDAKLAYSNTSSFVAAYFEKIAPPTINRPQLVLGSLRQKRVEQWSLKLLISRVRLRTFNACGNYMILTRQILVSRIGRQSGGCTPSRYPQRPATRPIL